MDDTPRAPRWMRLLLIVSLGLNLLVAGAVVGVVLRGGPPPRLAEGVSPLIGALPEADRRAILREVRERGPDIRENRGRLRDAFQSVLSEIRAEPLNPEALKAALDAQDSALKARFVIGREAVVARLAAMSHDDRMAFADRLEDMVRRGPHQRRGRD